MSATAFRRTSARSGPVTPVGTDKITEDSLKRIVQGEFQPGGRITERWLVDEFGATHTQAREALHRLDKIGAVILSPRRGGKLLSPEDADPADMRPVWTALLELAVRRVEEAGRRPAPPPPGAKRNAWSRHVAIQGALRALGEAGGNVRLTEALQRLAVQAMAVGGGRSPIDADALEAVVAALAGGRTRTHHARMEETFASSSRRPGTQSAAGLMLSGATPSPAQDIGRLSPQIRAFFHRLAGHIGPTPEFAPPAAEQLAAAIRQRIQFGELRPGDPVREQPLAQAFGVSRGPVRDALRALDRQGLVSIEGRRGAFVKQFSRRTVMDLFEIRAALSAVQMAEAAATRQKPDWVIGELRAGSKLLSAIAIDRDSPPANYIVVRRAVAVITLAASGNMVVGRLASELEAEVSILWATVLSKERQKKSAQTWRRIVEAIAAGDVEGARLQGRRIVDDAVIAALQAPDLHDADALPNG